MGEYTRNNGDIKCFWPDNDEDTLHIAYSEDLLSVIAIIKDHFKTDDLSQFNISAEYIQTDCLYIMNDHDPSDYTNFIVITRKVVR